MKRTTKEKVKWLDRCYGCTRQKPLDIDNRCRIWYEVARNDPLSDVIMDRVEDAPGSCSLFDPKVMF